MNEHTQRIEEFIEGELLAGASTNALFVLRVYKPELVKMLHDAAAAQRERDAEYVERWPGFDERQARACANLIRQGASE